MGFLDRDAGEVVEASTKRKVEMQRKALQQAMAERRRGAGVGTNKQAGSGPERASVLKRFHEVSSVRNLLLRQEQDFQARQSSKGRYLAKPDLRGSVERIGKIKECEVALENLASLYVRAGGDSNDLLTPNGYVPANVSYRTNANTTMYVSPVPGGGVSYGPYSTTSPSPMFGNHVKLSIQTPGGQQVPAATQPVNVNNRPGAADAPKCPVHKTRMVFKSEAGHFACTNKDKDGTICNGEAWPATKDVTLLRNQKYTGRAHVLAASSPTGPNGQQHTNIYLMLVDWGVVVDITEYIDINLGDGREPVAVNDDQTCSIALLFPKIEFAKGTS